MLSFEPNIVVVDDKKEEIQGIIDSYCQKGVGCKYFNADLYEGDSMPIEPFSNVNLIYLDLFYSEGSFDAELCSNWVQSLIPEKSFYVLVVWSKDPARADAVMLELDKLHRLPFTCIIKNKSEFAVATDVKYNYSKLFEEIESDIKSIPSIEEIGIWKKSIKRASNIVVGNLSKESNPELYRSKLQKIIVGHAGTSILTSTDNEQKRKILFDALDQVLISNSKSSIPNDEISEVNNEHLYSLSSTDSAEIDRELNSWFHFKLDKDLPRDLILPGLICENNHRFFKKYYSIQDDDKVSKKLENQAETTVSDIVMVLTRPCDIAQSKFGKNIKLLSGLALNNAKRTKKGGVDFNGTIPDSLKCYDHLVMNNEYNDATLLFDFRYVFSVPEDVFFNNFKNVKVFNKELLSEMQVEYSSYSSRLGITQVI